MAIEIITKEDLEAFRLRLLQDLNALLIQPRASTEKSWLKGSEVRQLLSISSGKLQTLRVTGKLGSTKIGGVHYYRYADLEKMMQDGTRSTA